ncbi:MAG: hypothetical protein CMQ79_01355 [Gammaproteobacteria bacterium]|nr:hypothetical protein [Gammaproteobacteria bacterium]
MDNAFEQFMNVLRRKHEGRDDRSSAMQEQAEAQRDAVAGDNNEPALLRESDEAFLRDLAAAAPVVLEQWNHYLRAGGAVTLEQAFFGGVNYALQKADSGAKAAKDYAFLHWLYLEQSAIREGKTPPKLTDLAKLYDPANWESVAQDYRAYRAGIAGLPDLSD